jgi:glyoxylase-like metal-dependent hydrolase (beta-lactamase superfamily II)/rhodanese-related sulfurtransferase
MRTPSLGDATYLLVHGSSAILVDPQRDVGRFLEAAGDVAADVSHVLETHVHNDYVSGGRPAAVRTGADLVLPAGSGVAFPFVPAFHGDDIEGPAGLTIRPLHTPGHTPEHVSYLVILEGEPQLVFTGGSMLVGSAGRSDLLGAEFAHQLAVLQHGSLQRLAQLPDAVGVFPTHGRGSFCTVSSAGHSTSTIGREKAENPMFSFPDSESFAAAQLSSLEPYPAYYQHMAPINRAGPAPLIDDPVPELKADQFADRMAGASVIDGRGRYAFAAGHVPGSLGIEHGDSFAPWAGWLLEFGAPVLLVLDNGQDAQLAATELGRIGFDDVLGVMRGVEDWAASGRELASFEAVSASDVARRPGGNALQLLDVRAPSEWHAGHLEGSTWTYVPELLAGLPAGLNRDQPVWLICESGLRSSIAAGLVERHGFQPIVVARGGVIDILRARSRTT